MIQTTYTHARANLAKYLDEATLNQETVFIKRRGKEDVALVSAAELSSLLETAHLLRSQKNAKRLMNALQRAQADSEKPQTLEELGRETRLVE